MPSYYETHYGISPGLPRIVKDALVAFHMTRDKGAIVTLNNIYRRLLSRAHFKLVDQRQDSRLPIATHANVRLEDMSLAKNGRAQDLSEIFYAPCPLKTLTWAVEALPIDHSQYTFIDCGSGMGYALASAARIPFQKALGVEFSQELNQAALTNIEAVKTFAETRCKDLSSMHDSVLDFRIPETPLVVFLFNPFNADVMAPWLQRLQHSVQQAPRDVWIVYVNPTQIQCFTDVVALREMSLSPGLVLQVSALSPYKVKVYRFAPDAI